jgi:antitoxin CcdA
VQTAYDTQAPKRAANLSINADLLSKARELNINLSATLEQALVEALRKKARDRWVAENKAAMEAYNEYVDEHGAFSDGLRSF